MKNKIFTLCIVLCASCCFFSKYSFSQTIEWGKSLGGSSTDLGRTVDQTADGGYIVGGSSFSGDGDVGANNGNSDFWIVKLTTEGVVEWENSVGGGDFDELFDIKQTADSGYIGVGFSQSDDQDVGGNKGSTDAWIVKFDDQGELEWEKSLGGLNSDKALAVQQTADLGYIIAGNTDSSDGDVGGNNGKTDYWIIKLNTLGEVEWSKNFGGPEFEELNSIEITSDNGYIVGGYSNGVGGDVSSNKGGFDCWVVKLTEQGEIEWEKNYGGSNDDFLTQVIPTTDGGYVLITGSKSDDGDVGGNNGMTDYWVVKINATGEIEWEKNFGGAENDSVSGIDQTTDGGYIISGSSKSEDGDISNNIGNFDYWIVKLDELGAISWEKNLGGSKADFLFDIQQTSDLGFVGIGFSTSTDGDISDGTGFLEDFWVVKIAPLTSGLDVETVPQLEAILQPNPSAGNFTVTTIAMEGLREISIYNILGDLIYRTESRTSTTEISGISKGIYFVNITNDELKRTLKLMVE